MPHAIDMGDGRVLQLDQAKQRIRDLESERASLHLKADEWQSLAELVEKERYLPKPPSPPRKRRQRR